MQNSCSLFKDNASIYQVKQQQTQREQNRVKNNHQNGAILSDYPHPFVKQTNKPTKKKQGQFYSLGISLQAATTQRKGMRW